MANHTEGARWSGVPDARTLRRWGAWAIVAVAGLVAWVLMMLAAVWQGGYVVLFFPAGWCAYVAFRQYRLIHPKR